MSQTESTEERLVTVRDIAGALYAGRWIIIGVTLLSTLGFGAYAFLATPIYRAAAVLAPVTIDKGAGGAMGGALGSLGDLASLTGAIDPKDQRIDEAIAVLKSRELLEKFIRDHDLLPQFFPNKWDAKAHQWKVPVRKQPTPWKGYKYFSEKVFGVEKDKKTGLITVHVDWRNREDAAEWANDLVHRVNEEMRIRAIEMADASTASLEKERDATQLSETRGAINRLIEQQIRQRMLASTNPEYVFRSVDRALVADIDDIFKPKKPVVIAIGVLGGLLLSCLGVLLIARGNGTLGGPSRRRDSEN